MLDLKSVLYSSTSRILEFYQDMLIDINRFGDSTVQQELLSVTKICLIDSDQFRECTVQLGLKDLLS